MMDAAVAFADALDLEQRRSVAGHVTTSVPAAPSGRRRKTRIGWPWNSPGKAGLHSNISSLCNAKLAGISRLNLQGNAEQQAADLRKAMSVLFPEAVTLVREAREGFGT